MVSKMKKIFRLQFCLNFRLSETLIVIVVILQPTSNAYFLSSHSLEKRQINWNMQMMMKQLVSFHVCS